MIFCSSRLATTTCLTLLALCSIVSAADDHTNPPANETHPGLTCTPFTECQPCPKSQLSEPFCQPFGNRQLMHCFNATSGQPPSHGPFNLDGVQTFPGNIDSDIDVDFDAFKAEHPEGETPAWGSCGRIVAQERADFFEFMACNIIFAAIALFVLFARSKRLRLRQARQLAARIGMVHGTSTGQRR
ncbi:hypothetical protein E4T56_gene10742 [Termitomyces sp. T112]|nr:hypothetical protein E4T56_gene10742 [Termitomyces sp. T112]KAH0581983.1 hypothetical protein H2248_011646 [Termitomyces sp. 'cryptogamus']